MIVVGTARHYDTHIAVRNAASELNDTRPDLIVVFCGGKHQRGVLSDEIKRLFPGVAIAGGSVAGTVTRSEASYSGFEVALVAFCGIEVTPKIVSCSIEGRSDFAAAHELGQRVGTLSQDGGCAILLYDSVAEPHPRRLHFGSSITEGFARGLGGRHLDFVGAGLLTDFNLDNSWVCDGDSVKVHCIVALVFPPAMALHTTVLPGSRPVGLFMEITEINGAEVIQIDSRPAYTVICEALHREPDATENVLALNVSLGQRDSGGFGISPASGQYVNRLIQREDKQKKTVHLFEPDFKTGDVVQLMIQDTTYMLDCVRALGSFWENRSHLPRPSFCMYFDCAGRTSILTGSPEEEGCLVMSGIPEASPAIGVYSGIEIAAVREQYRALDLTGVLATLTMGM